MSVKLLRVGLLALSGLALAFGLGSCGKVSADQEAFFDSNTNWLQRCRDDEQCTGSLRCYCSICTKPCGQDSECRLLGGAECAESGESLCGERASAGGLCVLACKEDVDCGAGFNCSAGQCVPKPCDTAPGPAQDWDQIFQSINLDLSFADPSDTAYLRYFALGSGSTDGTAASSCGITLSVKLQALTKLLNSLSIDPSLTAPAPIDSEQRLYRIDLRDLRLGPSDPVSRRTVPGWLGNAGRERPVCALFRWRRRGRRRRNHWHCHTVAARRFRHRHRNAARGVLRATWHPSTGPACRLSERIRTGAAVPSAE